MMGKVSSPTSTLPSRASAPPSKIVSSVDSRALSVKEGNGNIVSPGSPRSAASSLSPPPRHQLQAPSALESFPVMNMESATGNPTFRILLGRSKDAFHNPGNVRFRQIIQQTVDQYHAAASRKAKTKIVHAVYRDIIQQGGRFFKCTSSTTDLTAPLQWEMVMERTAKDKIGHALRDSQPKSPTNAHSAASIGGIPSSCDDSDLSASGIPVSVEDDVETERGGKADRDRGDLNASQSTKPTSILAPYSSNKRSAESSGLSSPKSSKRQKRSISWDEDVEPKNANAPVSTPTSSSPALPSNGSDLPPQLVTPDAPPKKTCGTSQSLVDAMHKKASGGPAPDASKTDSNSNPNWMAEVASIAEKKQQLMLGRLTNSLLKAPLPPPLEEDPLLDEEDPGAPGVGGFSPVDPIVLTDDDDDIAPIGDLNVVSKDENADDSYSSTVDDWTPLPHQPQGQHQTTPPATSTPVNPLSQLQEQLRMAQMRQSQYPGAAANAASEMDLTGAIHVLQRALDLCNSHQQQQQQQQPHPQQSQHQTHNAAAAINPTSMHTAAMNHFINNASRPAAAGMAMNMAASAQSCMPPTCSPSFARPAFNANNGGMCLTPSPSLSSSSFAYSQPGATPFMPTHPRHSHHPLSANASAANQLPSFPEFEPLPF